MAVYWLWLISPLLPEMDWGADAGFSVLEKINHFVETVESHTSTEMTLSQWQADRQICCPRLQITKGWIGQRLHFKSLNFSGKSKRPFICWALDQLYSLIFKMKKNLFAKLMYKYFTTNDEELLQKFPEHNYYLLLP